MAVELEEVREKGKQVTSETGRMASRDQKGRERTKSLGTTAITTVSHQHGCIGTYDLVARCDDRLADVVDVDMEIRAWETPGTEEGGMQVDIRDSEAMLIRDEFDKAACAVAVSCHTLFLEVVVGGGVAASLLQ
ncbi:hypothetical protein G7046_g1014 [Stylonectria norvegica]|nr:hypothetical protein G7046_g1014 [Stylonectria norvegica]